MKKILMIGTGGTIASGQSAQGLTPELSTRQLLEFVPGISDFCEVTCTQLFSLDSTNMHPAHYLRLVRAIRESYEAYDGFVICHGTDTMAYTAAALSYLIQGSRKPIVLTGAQKPISFDSTDSKVNLTDAFLCASADTIHGVSIVFNGKIIEGTRACKTRSKSYEAFSSINYPYLGVLQDGRLLQYIENDYADSPVFSESLETRVALLKLIPGTRAAFAEYLLRSSQALVIESFGVGGLPSYPEDDFLSVVDRGLHMGKTIVLTTQVQNEGSDVGVYQVGRKLRDMPQILEAFDMTTEAICAKLMWLLGKTKEPEQVRTLFYTPIAHDILNYRKYK